MSTQSPRTTRKGLQGPDISRPSSWGGGLVRSPPPIVPPSSPAQGLEIVNPQAAEKKVAEASQKYFSSMAEFLKVKGEKSGVMST